MMWALGAATALMLVDGVYMADGKPSLTDRVSARLAGGNGRWIATGVYATISLLFLAVFIRVVRL